MRYFSILDRALAENRALRFAVLVLGGLNVFFALLFWRAKDSERVIVVPPQIERSFWVSGNEVSREYLEQVFYYISMSLLNVSPETVDTSIRRIYVFLTTDPSLLRKIEEAFDVYRKAVKEKKVYQAFYPMSMEVKGNEVKVKGLLRKVVGVSDIEEREKVVKFYFRVAGGRLIVEGIEL